MPADGDADARARPVQRADVEGDAYGRDPWVAAAYRRGAARAPRPVEPPSRRLAGPVG